MRKPGLGEPNVGALMGAVVASTGGLFAVGIARAVMGRNVALLFETPILGLICWLVSGPAGWIIGGQIGPRLGARFNSQRGEIIGGVVGGLIPVTIVGLWGWYMVIPH